MKKQEDGRSKKMYIIAQSKVSTYIIKKEQKKRYVLTLNNLFHSVNAFPTV